MFSVVLIPTLPQKPLILCKVRPVEIIRTSTNGTAHAKGANLSAPNEKSQVVDKAQPEALITNHESLLL